MLFFLLFSCELGALLQAPWAGSKKRPFPEEMCKDDKSGRGLHAYP